MSEALGEARILIRPDTTAFRAQLEQQLGVLRKPIIVPVTAAGTGLGAATTAQFAASQAAATKSVENLATALRIEASQAGKGAVVLSALTAETEALAGAQTVSAGRTAAQARQLSQVERGAFSATASQFGLRGATLAASAGFIAAAVGVTATSKALKAAKDDAEALRIAMERLNEVVSATTANNVAKWAGGLASSFGVAKIQGISFAAVFEAIFKNFGVGEQAATKFSEQLVKVAANISIAAHVPIEDAFTALQRGLAGNGRALRTFQIFVDASRVSQEALRETGKKHASDLTREELILARYNIILRDSADRQQAFQDRIAGADAQGRIFSANLRNFATTAGGPVLAVITGLERGLNETFKGFHQAKVGSDSAASGFSQVAEAAKKIPGASFFGGIASGIGHAASATANYTHQTLLAAAGADKTGSAILGEAGAFNRATISIQATTHALTALNASQIAGQLQAQKTAVSRAQAFGGTGLTQLETELARIDRVIAKAQRRGTKGPALQGLFDERKAVIDQIKSINDATAAAAKSAADAAKSARDKEDQALLDLFGRQQTRITDALISAGPKAAIALTIRLRNLFRRQREEARKQIKDLKTRRDTLAADTTEIKTLNKQIRDLQKQQRDALAQQAQDTADARLTHLEALLSIAETTTGTGDDRRALERIIRFDEQRIAALRRLRHRTREQNAELDALRVDLAQREQALRALTTQQKKNQTAAAEFNFLQTQTGFVQNLIGNLIPGGATGLVGGQTGPTVPENVRPSSALSAAQRTSQANLVRGVTSGQAETQTQILRRILGELHRLNQGSDHPEAKKQRSTGSSAMDYHIQGTYGL